MKTNVRTFPNSDFEENLYVVWQEGANECVVIDPGLEPEEAIKFMEANRLTPTAILVTHGHYDHIGGIAALREKWPKIEILVGEKDRSKLTDPMGNLSGHFGFPVTTCDATGTLADGEEFTAAGILFRAILVPGHSAGHLVFELVGATPPTVFVGDVIFAGSVGRTDFPDGNTSALLSGIEKRLMTMPDETVFYTGHGPATTAGAERSSNPWL